MSVMVRRAGPVLFAFVLLVDRAGAQSRTRPYTLANITDMLQAGVSSEYVLHLATRSCIAFRITPDVENNLRAAGSDVILVAALRSACFRDSGTPASDIPRPNSRRIPSKVVPSPAITRVTTAPVVESVRFFRYEVATKSGDSFYDGLLPGRPAAGYAYEIGFDALGRPLTRKVTASPDFIVTYYYTGNSRLADSSTTQNSRDPSSRSTAQFERDHAGNQIKVTTFSNGKPSYSVVRTIYGDHVESLALMDDGSEWYREDATYSPRGMIARTVRREKSENRREETEYSSVTGHPELVELFRNDSIYYAQRAVYDHEGLLQTLEQRYASGDTATTISYYAAGLDTLQRSTRRGGVIDETRTRRDEHGHPREAGHYRNGELKWKYVYEYFPGGKIQRTLATGADGEVLAEYPGLEVHYVSADGHPGGHSDVGTIYKKPPWW